MNLKIQSIQSKILVWGGLCQLITGICLVGYAIYAVFTLSYNQSRQQALSVTQTKAAQIDAELEVAMDAARTIAQMLTATKDPNLEEPVNREEINTMLQQVLINNPTFLAVYTLWEPNAFDP